MGTIQKHVGTPLPPRMVGDFENLNGVTPAALKELFEYSSRVVLSGYSATVTEVDDLARKFSTNAGTVVSAIRTFASLVRPFVDESSSQKFEEELVSLGLEKAKARIVREQFEAKRSQIEAQARRDVRESFGPIISTMRWRVDRVVKSSEPIDLAPIGVVCMTFKTTNESYDQTFELDLKKLDELLEDLSVLRREMSELVPRSKATEK